MDEIQQAERHHRDDIAHIGEIVQQYAREHGFVSVYNEAVEELNPRLKYKLPLCRLEYEVTARLTVSVTMTVDAVSEEEAIEQASRQSYGMTTHSDWDVIDWDEDEISAELA